MLENNWALFKIQLKIAMKERFYFVYTLIVPIFMVFINKTQDFQDNESLYIYWTYIVVTTVFNGFLINIIRLRESGFFQTLTYLVGSKHSIILSNLLIQFVVIQLEILFFNLIVTLFITHVSLITFVYGFLVSFLATLVCAAMLSGLLLLKIKPYFFNLLIGLFFTLGIISLGVRPQGVNSLLTTVFNPFQLIQGLYSTHCSSIKYCLIVFICACCYLLMGSLIFAKISIKRQLR